MYHESARSASTARGPRSSPDAAMAVVTGAQGHGRGSRWIRTTWSRSSPAPDRGLAAAPVEERAFLVLCPLRAARPPLCCAAEGRRETADVGAGGRAVRRCEVDGRAAALALARIHPAGIAPARVLRRARAGSSEEKNSG